MTERTQQRRTVSRRPAAALGVALIALAQWGCGSDWGTGPSRLGSGRLVTETRSVAGFDALSVEGALDVTVVLDGSESLEITAEDDIVPVVRTRVQAGTLWLGVEPGAHISTDYGIRVRVGAHHLPRIESSGASQIDVTGVSGEQLEIVLSGASRLRIDGLVDRVWASISGVSSLDGKGLECLTADVSLSGASYGVLRVDDLLEADLSGVSTLEYLGDPLVHARTSGGSRVVRVGP